MAQEAEVRKADGAASDPKLPTLKRFYTVVAIAFAASLPGIGLRLFDFRLPAPAVAALAGVSIIAAGFLLSWSAEAAEEQIRQGVILAILALITVLPEYAVDVYFTFRAGRDPSSPYIDYAAANMTGANRLLIGIAWPLTVFLYWLRSRKRAMELDWSKAPEIAFLAISGAYSFVIVLRGSIQIFDAVVLFAIYGAYVWRVSRGGGEGEEEEHEEVNPAAALKVWPRARQFAAMGALAVWAAITILAAAQPFADSLVETGRLLGVDQFVLVQWLAPLASEAANFVLVALFAWALRPKYALGTLISDKINQWTLLVGILPVVFSIGRGALEGMPLSARQDEEFFLTAAQSLLGIAVLLRLRLSLASAGVLLVLFLIQFGLAFYYQADEPTSIRVLRGMAWVYLAIAAVVLAYQAKPGWKVLRAGLWPGAQPDDDSAPA